MTVSANFYNQLITVPGSLTHINATALNNLAIGTSGTVAIVGTCQSGQPKVPQYFTSAATLKQALGSGNAYDAARAVFAPSTQIVEGSPVRVQQVVVVRVDPATQSTLTVNDAVANPSLTFTSLDYGVQTNQINVTISSSTIGQVVTPPANDTSIKVVVNYNGASEIYDNIGIYPLLSVTYNNGSASAATISVSSSGISTTVTGVSGANLNIPFSIYTTLQQVSDYINSQPGYLATIPNTSTVSTTQLTQFNPINLDYVSSQNILVPTATNLYSVVYNAVSTINAASQIVSVARATPGNLPPAAISGAYLTGGSTPAAQTSDWQSAVNALQQVRVNFVVGTTNNTNIYPIFTAFGDAMQGVNECHIHLGAPAQQSFNSLVTLAGSINDPNVNLWFQQAIYPNDQGVATTYDPWMMAAIAAGFQGGTVPGTSFVNKSFNILGYAQLTSDTHLDLFNNTAALILARLSFVRFNQATNSYNVVRALTTYSQDNNDYHTESGIRSAVNYAVFNIRTDIQDKFLGARTLFTEAGSTASSIKSELLAYGQVLQDANIIIPGTVLVNNQVQTLPALVVDSVTITNDIVRLRYGIRPIGSISFIFHDVTLQSVQQVSTT